MNQTILSEIQLAEKIFDDLWPLNRSLTGNAVRESHRIIDNYVGLKTYEVPSGTSVYDWTVPDEWNISEAYIVTPDGSKICDISDNNLHLVSYSIPFEGVLELKDLKNHLYTIPELPTAIPYKTSYYNRDWGFCLTQDQFDNLEEGVYRVVIKGQLSKGSLTLSECIVSGKTDREILVHTYTCHPSMAINELSGVIVATLLARRLRARNDLRYSYRIVFAPETIGAISYISMREDELKNRLDAGLVCTCVGHGSQFTYKKSRKGSSLIDRAAEYVLSSMQEDFLIKNFSPSGSDERQYCSMGLNLPVGSLMRTPYHEYPEYHTSLDNKDLIDFATIVETVDYYERIFDVIEDNHSYQAKQVKCEPHMANYPGLYVNKDHRYASDLTRAVKWLMHYSDGKTDLIALSYMSKLPIELLKSASEKMLLVGLLER